MKQDLLDLYAGLTNFELFLLREKGAAPTSEIIACIRDIQMEIEKIVGEMPKENAKITAPTVADRLVNFLKKTNIGETEVTFMVVENVGVGIRNLLCTTTSKNPALVRIDMQNFVNSRLHPTNPFIGEGGVL